MGPGALERLRGVHAFGRFEPYDVLYNPEVRAC